MTLAEQNNAKVHSILLKAILLLSDSSSVPGEDISNLFKQLQEWISTTLQSVSNNAIFSASTTISLVSSSENSKRSLPSWEYLHNSFSLLETVKALSSTIAVAENAKRLPKQGAKPSKEAVKGLKELVNELHETIKSNARNLRSNVMGSGVLGALSDYILQQSQVTGSENTNSEFRQELEKTLDSAAVEIFCGELMESWEEGLGGILSLK